MAATYNSGIADEIQTFLDNDDWHYELNKEYGIFRFGVKLKTKMKNIRYAVDVGEDEYCVYAMSPLSAKEDDEQQMKEISEFVNRANYGIRDGNFELDFRDGEIRYKCYVNCKDGIPSQETIRASIYMPATVFNTYSPGIIAVLFSNMSAAKAVALCEGDSNGDDEENNKQDEEQEAKELSRLLSDLLKEEDNGDAEDTD